MVREQAVHLFLNSAEQGGDRSTIRDYEESCIRRDVWFEKLCFLDELIDIKLQERYRVSTQNYNGSSDVYSDSGIRYPVSGLV